MRAAPNLKTPTFIGYLGSILGRPERLLVAESIFAAFRPLSCPILKRPASIPFVL